MGCGKHQPGRRIGHFPPFSLQFKLSMLVTALVVLLAGIMGILVSDSVRSSLLEQIGKRALVLSQAVASNPIVRDGLQTHNHQEVQALAEHMRRATAAQYVVVCDRQGIRHSHPDPERIGKPFVGDDFHRAVEQGEAYVSRAVGSLGPTMRGFAPVQDEGGSVIGFVGAGYLQSEIEAQLQAQQRKIVGYILLALLIGVLGAWLIARTFKSAIFGLEPHEIAALFEERNAIIESIREGIVAIDRVGRLTLVNQAARRYLGQPPAEELRGCQLTDICPCREMEDVLAAGVRVLHREISVADRPMIVNVVPLGGAATTSAAVASFRPKDELDRLAHKLLHLQEYSELLRAQTHEYSNKLHTIAGLIQIGAEQEALQLVMIEASGYQELMKILVEAVPDPIVAGIILGKFNRARELKIALTLEQEQPTPCPP